jgi:hypothetical protein
MVADVHFALVGDQIDVELNRESLGGKRFPVPDRVTTQ